MKFIQIGLCQIKCEIKFRQFAVEVQHTQQVESDIIVCHLDTAIPGLVVDNTIQGDLPVLVFVYLNTVDKTIYLT